MDTADQKSIFGVLVGIAALFLLWLWASGNAKTLWAAASGTPSTTTPTTGAATGTVAANVVNGASAPLGGSTQISVPNYTSTLPAITFPTAGSIGGYTTSGAQSGGVSIAPTAIANAQGAVSSGYSGNFVNNALQWLGIGAASNTASYGTWDSGPAANVVGGNSAPLG
jgi:hypothetical protein